MIYCRCSIHKHVVQNESTRGKTKIILLTLEMARQVVSRTTHIEKGELRVTHKNAILTNVTAAALNQRASNFKHSSTWHIFGPFSLFSFPHLARSLASFNRTSTGVTVLKFCIRFKESRCILDLACSASFPVLPEPCFQFLKPELVIGVDFRLGYSLQ